MKGDTVFENDVYVGSYMRNRWVSQDAFGQYIDKIKESTMRDNEDISPLNVLDIGCGVGQFSIRLLTDSDIRINKIDAVDSSVHKIKALSEVVQKEKMKEITPHCIDIFNFETDMQYDVIICSEVIHLIDDVLGLFEKVFNLLSPGGVFVIRTSTLEQLAKREWYIFFPMCKYIDILRHKSKELLESASELSGFNSFVEEEIDESCYLDKASYVDRFRKKSYSTLHLIEEEDFITGLKKLEESVYSNSILFDYKMTCYLLKKN